MKLRREDHFFRALFTAHNMRQAYRLYVNLMFAGFDVSPIENWTGAYEPPAVLVFVDIFIQDGWEEMLLNNQLREMAESVSRHIELVELIPVNNRWKPDWHL